MPIIVVCTTRLLVSRTICCCLGYCCRVYHSNGDAIFDSCSKATIVCVVCVVDEQQLQRYSKHQKQQPRFVSLALRILCVLLVSLYKR